MERPREPGSHAAFTILLALLVVVAGLALAACGGSSSTPSNPLSASPSEAVTAETPVAMFRADLERTGVYPSGGPSTAPRLLWKLHMGEVSSPAVSGGWCMSAVGAATSMR